MRRSPLSHPLAVLRTTIGLTQKEMGALVNRAARTIQSIELRKMPLTEELALRIAEATGVDEAWLFAGDPDTPPRKGLTLLQLGRGRGIYSKADYEYQRAYLETPIVTKDQLQEAIQKAESKGSDEIDVPALGLHKSAVRKRQKEIIDLIDRDLTNRFGFILAQTRLSDDMRLVRWKLRRILEDVSREFSLEILPTAITVKALEMATPRPLAHAKVDAPPRGQRRKAKA